MEKKIYWCVSIDSYSVWFFVILYVIIVILQIWLHSYKIQHFFIWYWPWSFSLLMLYKILIKLHFPRSITNSLNDVTGQLIVILKVITKTLSIPFPARVVWVLSCWQTVFLHHLAYLFIHLTFTVAEADGLSLGYKFLTPWGFTASIRPICWA